MASHLVERLKEPALVGCSQGDKATSTALQARGGWGVQGGQPKRGVVPPKDLLIMTPTR